MARYIGEGGRDRIDAVVELWKTQCLLGDRSLLFPDGDDRPWSVEALADLDDRFNCNPLIGDDGGGRFRSKWEQQLAGAPRQVRLLGAEILLIHILYVNSVTAARKRELVVESVAGSDVEIPDDATVFEAFTQGIGNPGVQFNTRRDLQVGYLIDFALRFKRAEVDHREELLAQPWSLRDFADDTERTVGAMRHILLHLLRPEEFERISSGRHKSAIVAAFPGYAAEDPGAGLDEQLLAVRHRLEDLLPGAEIDFYDDRFRTIWGDDGGYDESAATVEALLWNKQLVFYGPPGTGKTWRARRLAASVIHNAAMRRWGPETYFARLNEIEEQVKKNTFWLQLHPAFGYEEFIRGLRLEGDVTRYREGYLPQKLTELAKNSRQSDLPALPGVLVLDEMNRTNLSEMLGEAFSLLDKGQRGNTLELPGFDAEEKPTTLTIPEDFYVIGTMNEIDQSVETLDFALRRRFLWRECGFDDEALREIVAERWTKEMPDAKRFAHDDAVVQLEQFVDRAGELNRQITELPELGRQFQIGHTYFADIVYFLVAWTRTITNRPRSGTYLWASNGDPRPALTDLWALSLRPLLEQYLAGSDQRDHELSMLEQTFLAPWKG